MQWLNELFLIILTASEIFTFFKLVQLLKANVPILIGSNSCDKVTSTSDVQPLNALYPIKLTELGISILSKLVQCEKPKFSIVTKPSGRTTSSNDEHLLNAHTPIKSTESGIIILYKLVQFSKTPVLMEFNPFGRITSFNDVQKPNEHLSIVVTESGTTIFSTTLFS